MVTALLAAASISDLILTPALLAGPLGYIIERIVRGVPAEAEADAESDAEVESAEEVPAPRIETGTEGVPPKPHLVRKVVRIRRGD